MTSDRGLLSSRAILLLAATPVLHALASLASLGHPMALTMQAVSVIPLACAVLLSIAMFLDTRRGATGPISDLLPRRAIWVAAGVIAFWIVVTLSVETYRNEAILRLIITLYLVLFGFAAFLFFRRFGPRPGWVDAIGAGLMAYAFAFIVYAALQYDDPAMDWRRFHFGVTNIRQAAFFFAPAAGLALGRIACESERRRALAWGALLALAIGLSAWAGNRSALLGMLVAFVIGLIAARGRERLRLLAGGLVASLVSLPLALMVRVPSERFGLSRIARSTGGEDGDISQGRARMWSDALDKIAEQPLIGHGEGRYLMLNDFAPFQYNHPHNFLLQWAFQWGVPMAVFLTLLLAYASLRTLGITMRDRDRSLAPLLAFATLGAVGMVEGSFYHPYPLMLMALFLMMVLGPRMGRRR